MKLRLTVNQIAIAALLSVGIVTLSAVFSRYQGLIELQCNPGGCRVVIDGRPAADLDSNKTPHDTPHNSEPCEQLPDVESGVDNIGRALLVSHEESSESPPCE